jgi:hypothetical protein
VTAEDGQEPTLEERMRRHVDISDVMVQLLAAVGEAGVADALRLALELAKNGVTESDVVPMLRASHVDGFADVTLQDAVAAAKTRDAGKDGVSVVSVRLRQIAATLTSPGEVDTLLYAADQLAAPVRTTALAADQLAAPVRTTALAAAIVRPRQNGKRSEQQGAGPWVSLADYEAACRKQRAAEAERDALAAKVADAPHNGCDTWARDDLACSCWKSRMPSVSLASRAAEVWTAGYDVGVRSGQAFARGVLGALEQGDQSNPYRAAAGEEAGL